VKSSFKFENSTSSTRICNEFPFFKRQFTSLFSNAQSFCFGKMASPGVISSKTGWLNENQKVLVVLQQVNNMLNAIMSPIYITCIT